MCKFIAGDKVIYLNDPALGHLYRVTDIVVSTSPCTYMIRPDFPTTSNAPFPAPEGAITPPMRMFMVGIQVAYTEDEDPTHVYTVTYPDREDPGRYNIMLNCSTTAYAHVPAENLWMTIRPPLFAIDDQVICERDPSTAGICVVKDVRYDPEAHCYLYLLESEDGTRSEPDVRERDIVPLPAIISGPVPA